MTKAIKTALIGILSFGLLACQGRQTEQTIEPLPEILPTDLKASQVEITEHVLDPDSVPVYIISNPAGTYLYAKPDTTALKVQTLFSGESFLGEKLDDTWVRMVLQTKVEENWTFIVCYAKAQDLSTKWQDITLNQGLMNQVSVFFHDSTSEPVYAPNDRRFAELSQYAQIELIDKATYEAASRERVEQFIIDTLTHRKQNGKISIPTKKGAFTIEDTSTREMGDDPDAENTYLGRTAKDGHHIINVQFLEGSPYQLINPETGKTELENWTLSGYPLLSPKGDFIISTWEDAYDENAALSIMKVNADKSCDVYAYIYYPFWIPYTHFHEPIQAEEEYVFSIEHTLPLPYQFWSRDNYFYLRIRPAAWRYKDLTERDPREYYARIKILDKPTGKPKLGK